MRILGLLDVFFVFFFFFFLRGILLGNLDTILLYSITRMVFLIVAAAFQQYG